MVLLASAPSYHFLSSNLLISAHFSQQAKQVPKNVLPHPAMAAWQAKTVRAVWQARPCPASGCPPLTVPTWSRKTMRVLMSSRMRFISILPSQVDISDLEM